MTSQKVLFVLADKKRSTKIAALNQEGSRVLLAACILSLLAVLAVACFYFVAR